MNVFVAGATGTLGVPLVRELVARGHRVTGLTRSPEKKEILERLGAEAVVADALDAERLAKAISAAAPTHVVHLLTALAPGGPRRPRDLVATNRLRVEGTRNLLRAAITAGAKRIVAESFIAVCGFGDHGQAFQGEKDSPPERQTKTWERRVVGALASLEDQMAEAGRTGQIEAIVLRLGLLYGLNNPATRGMMNAAKRGWLPLARGQEGALPWLRDEDAVSAFCAALERPAAAGIYNVVDDEPDSLNNFIVGLAMAVGAKPPPSLPLFLIRWVAPVAAALYATRLRLSNVRAQKDLGWSPRFPASTNWLRELADRRVSEQESE